MDLNIVTFQISDIVAMDKVLSSDSAMLLVANRLATFTHWPFAEEEGATCPPARWWWWWWWWV